MDLVVVVVAAAIGITSILSQLKYAEEFFFLPEAGIPVKCYYFVTKNIQRFFPKYQ